MMRTIIVRRNYLHFVKKYQRHDPVLVVMDISISCKFSLRKSVTFFTFSFASLFLHFLGFFQIWKKALKHTCTHIPMLPCEGRRLCHCRPMQVKVFWMKGPLVLSFVCVWSMDKHAQFLVLTVNFFPPSFRPLSKTVRFNVLKVIPAGSSGGGKKAFTGLWGDSQFSSEAGYNCHVFQWASPVREDVWSWQQHVGWVDLDC